MSSRFRYPFPPISNSPVNIQRQYIARFSTSYVYYSIILYIRNEIRNAYSEVNCL